MAQEQQRPPIAGAHQTCLGRWVHRMKSAYIRGSFRFYDEMVQRVGVFPGFATVAVSTMARERRRLPWSYPETRTRLLATRVSAYGARKGKPHYALAVHQDGAGSPEGLANDQARSYGWISPRPWLV